MRAIPVLLLLGVLLVAGCTESDESTPTGDEGIGSSGAEGTGSGGAVNRSASPTATSPSPTNG